MHELMLSQVGLRHDSVSVLHGIDLNVAPCEFITILGPSGCGKTSLLQAISGIAPLSAGEIHLRGRRIDTLAPEQRDIAMVFQGYALFPHLSVRRNLEFGLRMKRIPTNVWGERINQAVDSCRIGHLMDRLPHMLSGGQQQRVALARALVMRPALLLLDEPLSSLDATLREHLRHELKHLHRRTGTTTLCVTHDLAEAMTMSDRIVLMDAGQVVEVGTPMALYRRPRRALTAGFLGRTNLLTLEVQDGEALLPWGGRLPVVCTDRRRIQVSIRPEDIAVTPNEHGLLRVESVSFVGPHMHYILRVGSIALQATGMGTGALLEPGQRASVSVPSPLHALDESPPERSP